MYSIQQPAFGEKSLGQASQQQANMQPIRPIFVFFFITSFLLSGISFAQKERDFKKENEKATGKPGRDYNYTSGRFVYNPQTGKYEPVEEKWTRQPDEYHYDPKEWSKPKHKKSVYGKNPLKRLFKIKPKSGGGKPDAAPSDKESPSDKTSKPFTTGEEKKK